MRMAYTIAERMGKKHPFKDQSVRIGWYEGFKCWHAHLTLCSPQQLSYCRALYSLLIIFFAKLGELYGRLNFPTQVYNADESGINIVYKPEKDLAVVGRCNVYTISAAERVKIILSWHVFLLLMLAFLC